MIRTTMDIYVNDYRVNATDADPRHSGVYLYLGIPVPTPVQASAPVIDLFNHYRHGLPLQHGQQPWANL